MDEIYGLHPTAGDYSDKSLLSPENLILSSDNYHSLIMNSSGNTAAVRFGSDELISATCVSESASIAPPDYDTSSSSFIKAKIASHPHYPRLLQAYIDCHKVGAPPDVANILEEIKQESDVYRQDVRGGGRTYLGADPELDEFMETYCEILDKYKSDLSRPFDEATNFLNKIEMQLRNLCKGAFVNKNGDSETMRESSQDQGSLEGIGIML